MTDHPLFSLAGRTAVITGASRGLGLGIAEGMLRAGADVLCLQRSPVPDEVVELAQHLGRSVSGVTVDQEDPSSISQAITEVTAEHTVDILVNNAGTQARYDAAEFPLDEFERVLDVNTRAVFQLCQGFGGPMAQRGSGKIINIASLLSFQGGVRIPAYAASKGAVSQLTKALCNEWAAHGVNVNAIAPGYFNTDMNTALVTDPERSRQISDRIPAGRWGVPSDIAGAAVFLASTAADYVHGTVLPVDGGWLAR